MPERLRELWNANHGNVLLVTLILILVVGAGLLLYDQNRFVPVSFPDGQFIRSRQTTTNEDDQIPQLLVKVVNAANDQGTILVAIYQDEISFENKQDSTISQEFQIIDGQATLAIPLEILPARFAIAAFHDMDGDGVLDRNTLGIPTERYGFSRGARGLTGPPKFAAAAIDRPDTEQSILIELK
tara:strand:- start:71930 stop:72481 length:552 start_codon:yes stop_codon:yes gene_type:complete